MFEIDCNIFLTIPNTNWYARPAARYSLCTARALEVSRVHARSHSHSDGGDWGERSRLRSSECGASAPTGCERATEPLPASPQAVDALETADHVVSGICRLPAAQHHLQRPGRL